MTTYECKVLILDDTVTKASFSLSQLGIKPVIVNDIAGALKELGFPDPGFQAEIAVRTIQHDYDIVLLDFLLLAEDMNDYPMGGLTLHSLFRASFNASKRGHCIVCCYSDKMDKEYPKARYIFEITERKLRKQDGVVGLHQSGIGGIDWEELFRAKADSILSQAPFSVFAEIADLKANAIREKNYWDKPLKQLARFLKVDHCSLNQLLVRTGEPSSSLTTWLEKWLWQRSICRSTAEAYKALRDFAHMTTKISARQPDCPIALPEEDATGGELPSIKEFPIPRVLAQELLQIAFTHARIPITDYDVLWGEKRCRDVKKAFRLVLRSNTDLSSAGYTIDDLLKELNDEHGYTNTTQPSANAILLDPLPPKPDSIYVYVHRSILVSLLNGLQNAVHSHGPVTDSQGRILYKVKVSSVGREVFFKVRQKQPITSQNVVAIAEGLAEGKLWGPFPTIVFWGMVWIGCEDNTVFGVLPGFPLNLGLETPELDQGDIAVVLPYETV